MRRKAPIKSYKQTDFRRKIVLPLKSSSGSTRLWYSTLFWANICCSNSWRCHQRWNRIVKAMIEDPNGGRMMSTGVAYYEGRGLQRTTAWKGKSWFRCSLLVLTRSWHNGCSARTCSCAGNMSAGLPRRREAQGIFMSGRASLLVMDKPHFSLSTTPTAGWRIRCSISVTRLFHRRPIPAPLRLTHSTFSMRDDWKQFIAQLDAQLNFCTATS